MIKTAKQTELRRLAKAQTGSPRTVPGMKKNGTEKMRKIKASAYIIYQSYNMPVNF